MEIMFTDVSNDHSDDTRRRSPRRVADNCVSVINGKAYPVHNWSDGGLMVQADERMFTMSSPVEITMKFRLSDKIVDIPHRGRVVRKMRDRMAIQFEPLTRDVTHKFKQVIDDYVTREFAESQFA